MENGLLNIIKIFPYLGFLVFCRNFCL